ncbi:MAG TPA: hypothetical protein VJS44_17965 [Pyrinomonadaceae bacterium]|nr:hypothetical protein [Pyrinomonadaceae bacterium]
MTDKFCQSVELFSRTMKLRASMTDKFCQLTEKKGSLTDLFSPTAELFSRKTGKKGPTTPLFSSPSLFNCPRVNIFLLAFAIVLRDNVLSAPRLVQQT